MFLIYPKQGLHNGVLTLRVKELDAGRNSARGGGAGPSFRRSRCGFARIPLRSLAMLSLSLWCGERSTRWGGLCAPCNPRCFRRLAMLSLWSARPLLVSSVRLRAATAHAVGRPYSFFWGGHLGCRAQRRMAWGGAARSGAASSGAHLRTRWGRPLLASSGFFQEVVLGGGPRWGGFFAALRLQGPQRRTRWGGLFL